MQKNGKFQISDYLEDFDKVTSRGTCKSCAMLVTWNRERVASHKRAKCSMEKKILRSFYCWFQLHRRLQRFFCNTTSKDERLKERHRRRCWELVLSIRNFVSYRRLSSLEEHDESPQSQLRNKSSIIENTERPTFGPEIRGNAQKNSCNDSKKL